MLLQQIQHRLAVVRVQQNAHQDLALRQFDLMVFQQRLLLQQFADLLAILLR